MKTGTDRIDPSLFEHGLGLQLPFYIYLLKNDLNDTRFNNSKILGIYIHNILNKVNDESTLKLNGYTVNDLENISKLDNTYTKSSFIKSLAIGKDGNFGRYSKLISNEEIDSLSILVEEKIKELMNNIIEGKFDINPKKIEKKLDTCNFCEYKNICYKSLKDYIYLSSEKEGEK
jgi:ATP-dependent helicase/DNAse subunit B